MRRGFSQIEVLGAVVVLAIGLLSVAASLIYHFRVTQVSYQHMQAAALASRLLSAVRQQALWVDPLPDGLKDEADDWRLLNESPLNHEVFTADELEKFRRNISARRLDQAYNKSLFQVTLRLSWQENGVKRVLEYQAYQRQTPTGD